MSAKPATTYEQQIVLLEGRGMQVADKTSAESSLRHLNYYRLQTYAYPFKGLDGITFRQGTSFEQVIQLYDFDQKLRGLILASIKIIEVSVRSRFAYIVGHRLGPLAHLDLTNYRNRKKAYETLEKVREEFDRSEHSRGNENDFDHAPVWESVESFSFGNTSKLYANLGLPQLRDEISATYGIGERVLKSALYNLNVARNLAAHHARLWNINITEKLLSPNVGPAELIGSLNNDMKSAGCYNTVVMIVYLVRIINPRTDLPDLIRDHLKTLPHELLESAGMPRDWESRPLWSNGNPGEIPVTTKTAT